MRIKRWIAAISVLVVCAGLTACGRADQGHVDLANAQARIVFFDAGKADAILIETPQSTVLLDAGHKKNADQLVSALNELEIYALDAMIITHFDKDHIGGVPKVLKAIPVRALYEPNYDKDSGTFDAYREALEATDTTVYTLTENTAFELDTAHFAMDVANQAFYGEDEENDFSLVVRLTVGDARALLPGDAENPRLKELLDEGDLESGLLKVPHHGRYEKTSPLFFAAVNAKVAVITSSDEEPEENDTLVALKAAGASIYRTREGTVTALTDGENWTLHQGQTVSPF